MLKKRFESFTIKSNQPLSGLFLKRHDSSLFQSPYFNELDNVNVEVEELASSDSGSSIAKSSSDNISLNKASKNQKLGAWSDQKQYKSNEGNDSVCTWTKCKTCFLRKAITPKLSTQKIEADSESPYS